MAKLLKPAGEWNGKLVALDDGHGMKTSGKRTPYVPGLERQIKENEFNRAVVSFLADMLLERGFRVLFTAPTDYDTSLNARTDAANEHGADIFVSVHFNAMSYDFDYSSASGISVHIYPGHRNKAAGKLAELVGEELRKGTDQVWRGIKEDNFHVLRESGMPAILTENGFMDDREEALLMLKESYQKEVATETYAGICKYFGMKYEQASSSKKLKGATHYKDKVLLVRGEYADEDKGLSVYKGKVDLDNDEQKDKLYVRNEHSGFTTVKGLWRVGDYKLYEVENSHGTTRFVTGHDEYTYFQSKEEYNMSKTGFKDVQLGDDLQKEITKAKELGITRGVGNNRFKPEEPITRAEAAAFAVRAYEAVNK
ncbi:N-acetylmuramoyl-L-alanine amidase [Thalassobacillus sp. CUG 92003]|uniref:N-acetylmuramoyl-L-alanine amidase n=1 Tax=Thalassobacillus sp. CUG 92003 TaxID=2736641 RepID=UPI0015E72B3F|nr:N-acetylmuramoyl-L-alanine amidase [Thalassobacillus sp. CUG 92003]